MVDDASCSGSFNYICAKPGSIFYQHFPTFGGKLGRFEKTNKYNRFFQNDLAYQQNWKFLHMENVDEIDNFKFLNLWSLITLKRVN